MLQITSNVKPRIGMIYSLNYKIFMKHDKKVFWNTTLF